MTPTCDTCGAEVDPLDVHDDTDDDRYIAWCPDCCPICNEVAS